MRRVVEQERVARQFHANPVPRAVETSGWTRGWPSGRRGSRRSWRSRGGPPTSRPRRCALYSAPSFLLPAPAPCTLHSSCTHPPPPPGAQPGDPPLRAQTVGQAAQRDQQLHPPQRPARGGARGVRAGAVGQGGGAGGAEEGAGGAEEEAGGGGGAEAAACGGAPRAACQAVQTHGGEAEHQAPHHAGESSAPGAPHLSSPHLTSSHLIIILAII